VSWKRLAPEFVLGYASVRKVAKPLALLPGLYMLKRFLVLFLMSATLLVAGTPGAAAGNGPVQMARRGGDETRLSLNEAVRQVKRETGGRVLSAETVRQKGRELHRIKVLTPSGQVRVVVIDAQSRGR
jgi:hypothetical protein